MIVRVRVRARSWHAAKAVGAAGVGRDGGDGCRRARPQARLQARLWAYVCVCICTHNNMYRE